MTKGFILGVLTAFGLYAAGNAIYDKGYDDALEDAVEEKKEKDKKNSKEKKLVESK